MKETTNKLEYLEIKEGIVSPDLRLLFDNLGSKAKSDIDFFLRHNVSEILDYSFTLPRINEYLKLKKAKMIDNILLFLKNSDKYTYLDSGEPLVIEDVIKYLLGFDGDLSKFRSHVKKASIEQLCDYCLILFSGTLFI